MKPNLKTLALGAAIVGMCFTAMRGAAEPYPTKPIRLILASSGAGNAAIVARLLADPMGESLRQPVRIEPHPGASGNVAAGLAAKAPPDGYTLILLPSGHAVSANLYKDLAFDPLNDFQMISLATSFPFVMSVRRDSPFHSLGDLIAAAKAKPGTISFSSIGNGSTQHLAGELLQSMAGIKLVHVPYRGGRTPFGGLFAGRVDMTIETITVTMSPLDTGSLRALAESAAEPQPGLPDVPPVAATLPGYDIRGWTGLAGPKGLPQPIVDRLNQEVHKALANATIKARIEAAGSVVTPSTPDEMRHLVATDIDKFKKLIEQSHVALQDQD